MYQAGLAPFRHPWGVWELPIYYMDNMDFWMRTNRPSLGHEPFSTEWIKRSLNEPGLYVFDFHPLHIALNTSSADDYQRVKARILDDHVSPFDLTFPGRGAREYFLELCEVLAAQARSRTGAARRSTIGRRSQVPKRDDPGAGAFLRHHDGGVQRRDRRRTPSMKVAVVGANGFIGQRLCGALRQAATDVLPISSTSAGGFDLDNGLLHVLPVDRAISAVVYLSQSPHYRDVPNRAAHLWGVNVVSAIKAAEWARRSGAARFIYASTGTLDQPGVLSAARGRSAAEGQLVCPEQGAGGRGAADSFSRT